MITSQMLKIISILVFFSGVVAEKGQQEEFMLNFHQHDYQMKVERAEVVNCNKKYADLKVKTFKYNRTCTAFNITADVNMDFGNQVEIVVQAHKFASNEYRLFPMRFQLNVCDVLSKNIFGSSGFKKCGNFTGCPIKKGKQEVCNFTPDPSQLPPLIPNGKYMWELHVQYMSEEFALARMYLEIFRPFI